MKTNKTMKTNNSLRSDRFSRDTDVMRYFCARHRMGERKFFRGKSVDRIVYNLFQKFEHHVGICEFEEV